MAAAKLADDPDSAEASHSLVRSSLMQGQTGHSPLCLTIVIAGRFGLCDAWP
jgi:hypothetical protein